jgi:hypothetical protein
MDLASPSSHIDFNESTVIFLEDNSLSFSSLTAISGIAIANAGSTGTVSTTDLSIISDTSLTFVDDSYQNTEAESFAGLIGNTYMEKYVHLTCSTEGRLYITYSILQSGTYTVPSWISVDTTRSMIMGTTPNLSEDTTYRIYIQAESLAWSSSIKKEITLTVLKCK